MKKTLMVILIIIIAFQFTGFSFEKSEIHNNAYTIYGELSFNGEGSKMNYHELELDIPADKIVAVCFLNQIDNKGNFLNDYIPNEAYNVSYLGFKESETLKDCEVWSGGHSEPSRMRFFKTTDAQNGKFKVSVGLEKKPGNVQTPSFTWKYAVSVKILDAVKFEPLDSLGKISGDKNFFFSSGPEGLFQTDFYSYERRLYLCRAPINGNANIYWSHLNETKKDCYMGVLLTNKENYTIETTINALNYEKVENMDEAYTGMYTDLFLSHAENNGAREEKFILSPGESKWLLTYKLDDKLTGETTGIINLSTNYSGYKLICTTYAFDKPEYIDYIPINTADWELEAQANTTSMRGSGNGSILNLSGKPKKIPFETVLTGENIINQGENIFVTRLENNKYYTLDNKGSSKRLECGENGKLLKLTDDELSQLKSYNCNFGTIYKIDLKMLNADKGLKDGKKVVGKINFSPRVCAVIPSEIKYNYNSMLNVVAWRTKNGKLDYSSGNTLSLRKSPGIDPLASKIFYPYTGFQEGRLERSKEGVYWTFDSNIPFFDSTNEYSYYFVASGMSFLPFGLSFDYEDIKLEKEPYTVYINEKPVTFPDTKPQLVNDRLLVPVRGIFENMGAKIHYKDDIATIFTKNKIIQVATGSSDLVIIDLNKKMRIQTKMDVPSAIINDRIMIPLRAISESLGYKVDWYDKQQAIFIN